MPATTQPSTSYLNRDKSDASECSPFAASVPTSRHDALPSVLDSRQHLEAAQLPLIRVPSSLREVQSPTAASGTALASSRSTGGGHSNGPGGAACVIPYMPSFGSSSSRGRQRRVSDVSQAASSSLQTVLSLAAKVHSPAHASATLKPGQASRARVQPIVATARGKAGQGLRDRRLSYTGKGKTMGGQGLMRQGSHTEAPSSRRYSFAMGLASVEDVLEHFLLRSAHSA